MREIVTSVHKRVFDLFPLLYANSWKYKGVRVERAKVLFYHLRFEKVVCGRLAFVSLEIAEPLFNDPSLNLRDWILAQIEIQEQGLKESYERERDGAADARSAAA